MVFWHVNLREDVFLSMMLLWGGITLSSNQVSTEGVLTHTLWGLHLFKRSGRDVACVGLTFVEFLLFPGHPAMKFLQFFLRGVFDTVKAGYKTR